MPKSDENTPINTDKVEIQVNDLLGIGVAFQAVCALLLIMCLALVCSGDAEMIVELFKIAFS